MILSTPDLQACPPPFLFFFFFLSGPPRDLHSFPTRRSSDLPARLLPIVEGTHHARISSYADIGECMTSIARRGDRKSTRLNSSHRCISYAVFCLKKKTAVKQRSAAHPNEL